MRLHLIFYLLCIPLLVLGQEPELVYNDGGDIGPIEIRDDFLYYYDNDAGLKRFLISDTEEAELLVIKPSSSADIKFFFWGVDEEELYLCDVVRLYEADITTNIPDVAEFYDDFSSQFFWDVEQYEGLYYISLSDVGTIFGVCLNITPFGGCGGLGGDDYFAKNIAVSEDDFYYTNRSSGDQVSNSRIFSIPLNGDGSDIILLTGDIGEINDMVIANGYLYTSDTVNDRIYRFDVTQNLPWQPEVVVELDGSDYDVRSIAVLDNYLYFSDALEGRIYRINLDTLGVEPLYNEDFTVYPNPVKEVLTINSNSIGKALLYGLDGKILKNFKINSRVTTIDLEGISQGIYFLSFTDLEDRKTTTKFIKR